MRIGGFNNFSLSDYPGHIATVIFTQGCNFKCGFCHNGSLIPRDVPDNLLVPEKDVFEFLERRRNQLDGVVVSGGEPTIQPDLSIFLYKIKNMGFSVKLDTNGSKPEVIESLLEEDLLDYLAMDIKAPLSSYKSIAQIPVSTIDDIMQSINLISRSGIAHEFRTTYVESYLSYFDIRMIRGLIPPGSPHRLQEFHPEHALDPLLRRSNKTVPAEQTEAVLRFER